MKNLILLFITLCCCYQASAVNKPDTLKFNKRYTECEKKWVVLSKADTTGTYSYGYIYIDHAAGFTYQLTGKLKVDANGKYSGDTSAFKGTSVKYRITPNWKDVALLPAAHFKELNIQLEPAWVKTYYSYTDTVQHNYRWGWIYNDLRQCDTALTYLLKAYKVNPAYNGLEFEIVFAYNELKQYDDAIAFLNNALKKRPDDVLLYRELGYAYLQKEAYAQSIEYYTKGISKCADKQLDTKSEMALNMANAYNKKGDRQGYDKWIQKAKEWAPPGSQIYQHLNGAKQ